MRRTTVLLLLFTLVISMQIGSAARGESTISQRVTGRDYPSVFQAWNPAEKNAEESTVTTEARHDLLFHAADFFGLRWDAQHRGLATDFSKDSLAAGKKRRESLLNLNPNMALLCEIRYRDAHQSFLPTDSEWWDRNAEGKPIVGWEEGGYLLLDFGNVAFQDHVAKRCKAALDSGVFDGVFLDWWVEDDQRISLVKKIRQAVGEDALILVNANDRQSPLSAPHINGHFMECFRSASAGDWERIEASLVWAEAHLRQPRINCLETWYAKSRDDFHLMRATTALGLTRSNGYVLFSDPNPLPTPDHLHNWYAFWDAKLGTPVAAGEKRNDGSTLRRFENGYVAYNPPGNPTTVTFTTPHRRYSNGRVAKVHQLAPLDGDIFIPAAGTVKQDGESRP